MEKRKVFEDPALRVWLSVPFERKEEAKALGARWCPIFKRWYAMPRQFAEAPSLAMFSDGGRVMTQAKAAKDFWSKINYTTLKPAKAKRSGARRGRQALQTPLKERSCT
ncbi:MAG: hypothetical protein IPN11_14300 [Opitutaceae bacterium]|nr:hypothetical protein [Opitutaceae bacterium]